MNLRPCRLNHIRFDNHAPTRRRIDHALLAQLIDKARAAKGRFMDRVSGLLFEHRPGVATDSGDMFLDVATRLFASEVSKKTTR